MTARRRSHPLAANHCERESASPERERSEARDKKCETRPGYADRLAPLPTAVQVVWLRRNPAWRVVFEQDGVLVFKRVLPP